MNIIPAIDIKNGKVVKAIQGDRDKYKPINNDSGFSSDPFKFIKEMTKIYRPSTFYIADINSLTNDNHNIDLIKSADHIIDLGPYGGDNGGQVVFAGTPEELVKEKKSLLSKFLKPKLSFK